jgi:hypothetical protein
MAYVAALHASKNDVEDNSSVLKVDVIVVTEPGAIEDDGPELLVDRSLGITKLSREMAGSGSCKKSKRRQQALLVSEHLRVQNNMPKNPQQRRVRVGWM